MLAELASDSVIQKINTVAWVGWAGQNIDATRFGLPTRRQVAIRLNETFNADKGFAELRKKDM